MGKPLLGATNLLHLMVTMGERKRGQTQCAGDMRYSKGRLESLPRGMLMTHSGYGALEVGYPATGTTCSSTVGERLLPTEGQSSSGVYSIIHLANCGGT